MKLLIILLLASLSASAQRPKSLDFTYGNPIHLVGRWQLSDSDQKWIDRRIYVSGELRPFKDYLLSVREKRNLHVSRGLLPCTYYSNGVQIECHWMHYAPAEETVYYTHKVIIKQ